VSSGRRSWRVVHGILAAARDVLKPAKESTKGQTRMQPTETASAHDLEHALKADHAALEDKFSRVTSTMHRGDPEFARAAWLSMEAELLAHLKAEEELIMPSFSKVHPQQAARIRRDHDEIREELQQLGIALDLHTLRAERADAFVHSLREHASYEDEMFYRWAQSSLPEGERRSVFGRLRSLLHTQAQQQSRESGTAS
jgi:hemerythrin superfamily protein